MQCILMFVFSSVFFLLQDKGSGEIVGRWEAMETTKGLGSSLQFNPDGSFTYHLGSLVNGTYKLEGNKLSITASQHAPEKTRTEVLEVKIEGDTLLQKTEGGMVKLVRLIPGAANSPPIVGIWCQKTPIYEFRSDGTFDMTLSDRIHNGTYKLDGTYLYITMSSQVAKKSVSQRWQIDLQGDTLVLSQKGQPDSVMHRISPSKNQRAAIIGRWHASAADGTDNLCIIEYKQNGECVFRMPIMMRKGRYDIKGGVLTNTFDDGEVKISRMRFESGVLILKSPPEEGAEEKFKRIE